MGVFIVRALLFGVYMLGPPISGNSHEYHVLYTVYHLPENWGDIPYYPSMIPIRYMDQNHFKGHGP